MQAAECPPLPAGSGYAAVNLGEGLDGAVQLGQRGIENSRGLGLRQRGRLPQRGCPFPQLADVAAG